MKLRISILSILIAAASVASARTIHRSFRTREVGVGGGFGVAMPVDSRIDKAIDEGRTRKEEHAKLFAGQKTANAKTNTVRVVRRVKVVKPKPQKGDFHP